MAKNYYLKPSRSKACRKSQCGDHCPSPDAAVPSPAYTESLSIGSCSYDYRSRADPLVPHTEANLYSGGFEADQDDPHHQNLVNSNRATINECNKITPSEIKFTNSSLRDQESMAMQTLSEMNSELEKKLTEMRAMYSKICLQVEEKKNTIRLQEVRQDGIKDSQIDLSRNTIRLPEPMNRSGKEVYINYLLSNVLHDLHETHNVAMGEMLDDDVITTVIETSQLKYPDILFVNPCITQCIQFSHHQDIASFLDPINASSYANVFFVINDTSSGSQGTHWSLLLLSREEKAFCHYDSLRGMNDIIALELSKKLSAYFDTWQILDVECEQQTNNTDCGIYVLDNMLRIVLVLKNDVNIEGERVSSLSISKLPASFTKTRIYMIVTYINAIIQKAKRTLCLEDYR